MDSTFPDKPLTALPPPPPLTLDNWFELPFLSRKVALVPLFCRVEGRIVSIPRDTFDFEAFECSSSSAAATFLRSTRLTPDPIVDLQESLRSPPKAPFGMPFRGETSASSLLVVQQSIVESRICATLYSYSRSRCSLFPLFHRKPGQLYNWTTRRTDTQMI